MKKLLIMLTPAAMLVLAAPFAIAQESQMPAPATVDAAKGLSEWDKVYAVFSHPRCADCHVADERPRWSGAHYGGTRVHAFNVQRGADGSGFGNPGLRCTTCHFASKFQGIARSARGRELASGASRDGLVRQILGRNLRPDQGSPAQRQP
ncbi:hypothetical protein [Mesorhizobium sp. M0227]|uniref:hypothetical protein n=1 Tax=Mesorhizobium sp. M0227 TaxID=2956922 RepID=UPI00333CD3F0